MPIRDTIRAIGEAAAASSLAQSEPAQTLGRTITAVRKTFPLRYVAPGCLLALVIFCGVLYTGVRSYAPAAARAAAITLTPTPFLPATITPTPFGPEGTPQETPTLGPGSLPTLAIAGAPWAPYAGPIYPASTAIPTPAATFAAGPDQLNIALLGMDLRPGGGSYRTDTIMILHLDKAAKRASLISFPRDLYVYVPAFGMTRINEAFPQGYSINYPGGGFALFQDTMKYNFGIPVDHYAMMNFWGFQDLIDSLGGVDVNVGAYLSDKRDPMGRYTVEAGINHMDGSTALWYVRSRYTSSDIDRNRRQQEVLLAMGQRLLSLNALGNIPGFFVTLAKYVESDLTLDIVTPYAELGTSLSPSSIQRYGIAVPDQCTNWTTPEGAMVLLPNYDAIRSILESALAS